MYCTLHQKLHKWIKNKGYSPNLSVPWKCSLVGGVTVDSWRWSLRCERLSLKLPSTETARAAYETKSRGLRKIFFLEARSFVAVVWKCRECLKKCPRTNFLSSVQTHSSVAKNWSVKIMIFHHSLLFLSLFSIFSRKNNNKFDWNVLWCEKLLHNLPLTAHSIQLLWFIHWKILENCHFQKAIYSPRQ